MRFRRAAVAGTVLALMGSAVLVVSSGPAPVPRQGSLSEAPDAATAVAAAWRQGSRVEVADQRTSTSATFANPGGLFTTELTPVPVRVKLGGSWVRINPSLVRRPDGSVGPIAAEGELSLSGGGSGPALASLRRDGRTLALHWPDPLPAPTLSGSSATYHDVLPGTDLVMHAERNGFRQHLVLKNAEAARNPALASIRLGLRTEGLRVSVDDAGAIHAVDEAGIEVFTAPRSRMWDTAGRTAPVGVSIVDGALILAPDQKFLTDPELVYPVTVDPTLTTFHKEAWATVLSGKPTTSYWNTSGAGPTVAQVGQCYRDPRDDKCDGIGLAYAYFQFDTTFLAGRTIHGASFDTSVVHSPVCDGAPKHVLARAHGEIFHTMTWNNKWGGYRITEFEAPTACTGGQPVGLGVPANHIVSGGKSTYYLLPDNDADQSAWRKYDPGATVLRVHWNRAPYVPYDLTTSPPLRTPCGWCGGVPYVADDNIRLIARLSDPDGDSLLSQWRTKIGTVHNAWDGGWKGSGATHDTIVDLREKHGALVSWWLHASDGAVSSGEANGQPFVVDRVGVDRQPTVAGVLYQEDGRWHGGAGVPGTFTFGANGVDDIDHYLYGWQDPPSTKVDAQSLGGPASVTLSPPGDGPRDLYVQSVDRAGHRSPTRVYHFYVRAGNGALAQWSFEGNANDSAFLGDRHGTPQGGAAYTAQGALGSAVALDGIDDHVSAPNAIRNDAGFTVSAWVNLKNGSAARAVVSQDGAFFPGFVLWHRAELDGSRSRWVFGVPNSTTESKGIPMAESPVGLPQLNRWTHLTGVRDPAAGQIRLFVNGVLVATAAHTASPEFAPGPVRIGRTVWGTNPAVDYWPGGIDEVQLHDRVLSAAEIAAMVGSSGVQAAHWKFDEESGTTARNAVGGGADGVLENGAALTPDGAVHGGVRLDGIDDAVSAGQAVVRTDQSFTVAAQVKLDRFDGGTYTVISQDGDHICGFCLQYQTGRWVFVFPRSDADSPASYYAVSTPATPKPDGWTHLVGTYDAATKNIRLYVDGTLVGESSRVDAWPAQRALRIGQAIIRSAPAQRLPGTIDEVRVYNRVISEDEVRGIVSRDNVTAGTWTLDGNANDANGRLNGTLTGGPEWTAGQTDIPNPNDLSVKLNGTGAHVSAPNAIDTDKSFSVAAWARLDRIGAAAAVVSQDGLQVSGFVLRALADGRWDFLVPGADQAVAGDQATGQVAQPGVWTHLVGVYSRDRQRIELYVNGVLTASAAHTGGFDANGLLHIGRSRWDGNPNVEYFPGAIDDVSVYSRVLFAGEIQAMAGRDVSLGHNWTMDEGRGSTTGDAVGARAATLENGASFGPGRVGNATRFDGVDDVASTTGVDVRTDASFTVSAWVRLDGNDCDRETPTRCVASAVSLDGGGESPVSKFRLGHLIDNDQHTAGKWVFEMPERGGTITEAAVDVRRGQLNTWVHLTGVYDASVRTIWLYVNGTEKDEGTLLTAWQATGPLRIGSGRAGGAPAGWRGGVDDVRMYSGALTADRISALHKSYPADGPAALPVADAGWWTFDENTGTTAADSSGRGQTATMRNGAGWYAGRVGPTAWFDGSTGYAETAGPVLDTAGSFSAAAWAYLTDGTRHVAVVGQDGLKMSSFLVQYDATAKRWAAVVTHDDEPTPRTTFILSAEPALVGYWTHLAVVYDAPMGQLRLYVNGSLSAVQVGVSVRPSNGPLAIGRCKWNGNNGCYFPRGIDDVRAYGRALSDGEVRRVHDDAAPVSHGFWRFDDDTARDSSWRQNPTTLSGGTSFTQGMLGQALQLDGVSGAATAQFGGVPMQDSFTVAGWARLDRGDKAATVLGQDGDRRSGYFLQYRPEVNRWMFGAASHDADSAPLVYANSLQPPVLGRWTHLTGVYDYPARQLRLYVNGEHVGTRDNVLLWLAHRGFTIGRGKHNGVPAEFFPGAIDDVTTDMGVVPDAEIRARAGRPAPSGGQLGRFVSQAGDHYTANATTGLGDQFAPVPPGYRFEGSLGTMLSAERQDTRRLYACMMNSTDEFTSTEANCEGHAKLADLGWVYRTQPADWPTIPLYRCRFQGEYFDSASPTCEDKTTDRLLLGYVVGYAPLTSYAHSRIGEYTATTAGTPPGYRHQGTLGLIAMVAEPGTVALMSCVDGVDQFLSLDPVCDGKTVLHSIGRIWTAAPPGRASTVLYQCAIASGPLAGERFASTDSTCGGQTVRGSLGHVLTVHPGPTAA